MPSGAEGQRRTRPHSDARAQRPLGGPSQPDVTDPVDLDEEDPRIYSRQDGEAVDADPDLCDFRDYGDARDWTSVSIGEEYPGGEESS